MHDNNNADSANENDGNEWDDIKEIKYRPNSYYDNDYNNPTECLSDNRHNYSNYEAPVNNNFHYTYFEMIFNGSNENKDDYLKEDNLYNNSKEDENSDVFFQNIISNPSSNEIPAEPLSNEIPAEPFNNEIPAEPLNNEISAEPLNNEIRPEMNINNEIRTEEVNNDRVGENNENQNISENADKVLTEENKPRIVKMKKKNGRKTNKTQKGKITVHTKKSEDNIMRKIKANLMKCILKKLNNSIKFESGEFFPLTPKINVDLNIELNKILLNRTIADIFGNTNLNGSHINKGKHNQILIEKIFRENIETETIKILSMTFQEILKEIRKENLEEFLTSIKNKEIKNEKIFESENEENIEENIGEDCDVDNYMKEVKDLLVEYENYFLKRKSRGKKKTN